MISITIHLIAFSSFIIIAGNLGKAEQTLPTTPQIINIEMIEIQPAIKVPVQEKPLPSLPLKETISTKKIPKKIVVSKKQPQKEIRSSVSQKATQSHGIIPMESYTQKLSQHINKHKYYPKSALRNHIEGLVSISFKVDVKGYPYNINYIARSGHNILDNAAKQTLKRATPLPISENIALREFTIPIRYSIK